MRYTTQTTRGRLRTRIAAATAVVALVAASCGGDDDTAAGSAGASGDPTVEIMSPAPATQVGRTFPVAFDINFPIGEPDTGRQHIHLHFDDDPEYDIIYDDTHTVSDLEPGEHTLVAVIANADHSETDTRSGRVAVEVTDGAPDVETPDEATPPDDGFDY